ncbi:MAG TPA: adenosylcobalamin-dependent ribonucleoside-diphosphate reductase, partial [Maribacter sp.]|nr:adenosylcobalamin-dependent ribonucleoside-diphosphate reductase [Maribacter sp.]
MHNREEVEKETLNYFGNDELATNVWMTKYCLKDKEGNLLEKTPEDMHRRLAREFARVEKKFNGLRTMSEEQIFDILKNFDYVVPQGSPMMGIGNNHVNVSLSNCVVVGPPGDNISSIMDSGKDLANLFKRRCGVGLDLSHLRPENASVNNSAGTTSGAWSFADLYSYVCRMIGQNGRRGALMLSMDIRHPDIEQFVTMKHDLTKVTGANVSVKISDEFMKAVENNETFTLKFPIDSEEPTVTKEINATELWERVVDSATKTAEPGLLMWDNILKYLPANEYEQFKTECVNPCAELPLSAYDSCRLISINLKNFVTDPFTENARFNFKKFSQIVAASMRLSDDLVELELEKLENIRSVADMPDEKELWKKLYETCANGRRTGLGTHGLADVLACLNLAYDSDESLAVIDKIYKTLKTSSYEESVELAIERGAFPAFSWETEKDNAFIKSLPKALRERIEKHGRRNISILTNAPTGSVSIMSQTSSGLEPVFRNSYVRRRKLDHSEKTDADFIDDLGDRWKEFKVYHHNVRQYLDSHEGADLPNFFTESHEIDWMRRIEIQAARQRHIDHSISSTINLPKGTPSEVVGELYFDAWRKGLKGVTVYVDGSRTGVLLSEDSSEKSQEPFPQNNSPKRPIELECEIHRPTIQGEEWTILVGLMDGKPYEIMGGLSTFVEIPKKYTHGTILKHPRKSTNSIYDLKFGENGGEVIIKNVVKVFDNPNHSVFTRMISLALRHGSGVQYVVEQLNKDRDSDM